MARNKKYFDISSRDELYEQNQKIDLNSAWKQIKESVSGYTGAGPNNVSGDAMSTGGKLKSHQSVTPMEEQEEPSEEEMVVDDTEEVVPDDAPPAGEEIEPAPEPISVDEPEEETIEDTPEVDAKVEEANAKTQEFISKALSNLPSDVELTPFEGVFKGDVQDEHLGAFTVVVYPNDLYTSIHDAAAIVEPEENAGPEAPDLESMEVDDTEEVVEPTETPSEESPLDMEEPTPVEEPATEEEPVEDEELAEEMEMEDDEEEYDEIKMEESRDPTNVGKKDWKLFLESRYGKK